MKTKIIAAFLAAVLLFTFVPCQVFAEENESLALPEDAAILDELEASWGIVQNATKELGDQLGTAGESVSLFTTFGNIVAGIGKYSSIVTAVNGSVNFLRLIGVLEDPTASALKNIQESLNRLDEKMNEVNDKLNALTDQMTQVQASQEFNDRAERSRDLYESWHQFDYNYMENGLDSHMDSFNTYFSRAALQKWFGQTNTERQNEKTDISMVLVKYVDNEPVNTLGTSIPASVPENEKYILLTATCIPEKLIWENPDKALGTETDAVKELLEKNKKNLETVNCSFETATDAEISLLAKDAVSALNYRILTNAIRTGYEKEVSDYIYLFRTYCNNLTSPGKGVDAWINAMYLSHAFEFEIKNELQNFVDQMIFKTGTYYLFIQDLMGMSSLVTESEKKSIADLFNTTIKSLNEAKTNSVTGKGNYCYLTGALTDLSTITYENTVSANVDDNGRYHTYKGASSSAISRKLGNSGTMVNDVQMQILYNTLKANGNGDGLISYLSNGLGSYAKDYGYIVTSEKGQKSLPLDNNESLYYYRASGTWLGNSNPKEHPSGNISLKSLPSDFDRDEDEFIDHRMYTGTVFDDNAHSLLSNFTLHATATYAESSMWWFTDEVYFFGGPYRSGNFTSHNENNRVDYWHIPYVTYKQTNQNTYNTLLTTPYESLSTAGGYSPLSSLKEINEELSPKETKSESKETVTVSVGSSEKPGLLEGNPDTGAPVFLFYSFWSRLKQILKK